MPELDNDGKVAFGKNSHGRQWVHNDYTVGWICALSIELAAAKAVLDEKHPRLQLATGDKNIYTLGRIASHCVVVTCLPQGTVGTNAAASVVADMLRSFTQLRFVLMVGVGGAAPDPAETDPIADIRLGDVVVSKPMGNSGGVIQYDLGKTIKSGIIKRKGSLNKPPAVVRSGVSDLEATHLICESKVTAIIKSAMKLTPKSAKLFEYPGQSKDLLYQANYRHLRGNTNCNECDSSQLVCRKSRDTTEPTIHYGLIASANQVMEDPYTRDKLRKELSILCFEMEAAGLMDNSPCLVIRGMSDYSDSHKNNRWQPYAALSAAAYAKELLQNIPSSSVVTEEPIKFIADTKSHVLLEQNNKTSHEILNETKSHHQQLKEQYYNEHERACVRVFDTCDYEQFKNNNQNRAPNTCQWAVRHSHFEQWQKGDDCTLLWISADPGCGKSVLAKYLVDDELKNLKQHIVCHFFFKEDNKLQTSLSTALCAILHQIFSFRPDLVQWALPMFNLHGQQLPNHVGKLWDILLTVSNQAYPCRIMCVLDALDECNEADLQRFARKLCEHCSTPHANDTHSENLKFLITSRPYNRIEEKFDDIMSAAAIRLRGEDENKQINQEINSVINGEVKTLARKLSLSNATATRLAHTLKNMEHRTYLWLYLAKADIIETYQSSLQPDYEMINTLPKSVEEAYEKILDRIPDRSKKVVRTILQIVITAHRPLTIEEMASALGVAILSAKSNNQNLTTVNQKHLERNIRHWCGLFVFVNNGHIYLIHQTAKNFLLNHTSSLEVTNSHWRHSFCALENEVMMTRICAQYITWKFDSVSGVDDDTSSTTLTDTFFDYAAINWPDHARPAQQSDGFPLDLVLCLSDPSSMEFKMWFTPFWKSLYPYDRDIPVLNSVMIAAFNGHEKVLNAIFRAEKRNSNDSDDKERTALMWGSLRGNEKVVQLLITKGADVNHQSRFYGNPLQLASTYGHEEVARILLDNGANVTQQGLYGNALWSAASAGHTRIVQLLIQQKQDITIDILDGALEAAAELGHKDIVQVLLETRSKTIDGGSLFDFAWIASYHGHADIVEILLEIEMRLDVKPSDLYFEGVISAASSGGHEKVVEMLLDRVVNCGSGEYLMLPLHTAAEHGHDKVVEILLQKVAKMVSERTTLVHQVLSSALKMASRFGLEYLVHIFLTTSICGRRRTLVAALQLSVMYKHENVTNMILATQQNSSPAKLDQFLQMALDEGFEELVLQLLIMGADRSALCPALIGASAKGNPKMVRFLLKTGPNRCQDSWEAAFKIAATRGHGEIMSVILAADEDLSVLNGPLPPLQRARHLRRRGGSAYNYLEDSDSEEDESIAAARRLRLETLGIP